MCFHMKYELHRKFKANLNIQRRVWWCFKLITENLITDTIEMLYKKEFLVNAFWQP